MKLVVAGATGVVGRHVVEAARARGHEVISLSRSSGHDLLAGRGLTEAMHGADAVIDVSSTTTLNGAKAQKFFATATRNLHAAERAAGIEHHIGLSIVGIDGIDASHYAGKHAQEHAIVNGPVPWSILRATQFHEFAEQMLRRLTIGPVALAPKVLMRPVAAREVGMRLVEIAEGAPAGRVRDLTGPRDERLANLIRQMLAFDEVKRPIIEVTLPGAYGRGLASGVLRGTDDADRGRITFDEWLRSDDHTHVAR